MISHRKEDKDEINGIIKETTKCLTGPVITARPRKTLLFKWTLLYDQTDILTASLTLRQLIIDQFTDFS